MPEPSGQSLTAPHAQTPHRRDVRAAAAAVSRWAVLLHVIRIASDFGALLATLIKLFSDTRVDALDSATAADAQLSPPQPPPPPAPPPPPPEPSPGRGTTSVALMLMCIAFSIAAFVASILATGGIVQHLGGTVSSASSGTSVWSRVSRARRSGHGRDAARALVPRGGLLSPLGNRGRVAPSPPRNTATSAAPGAPTAAPEQGSP